MLNEQHGKETADKILKEANDNGSEFNKFELLDKERLASFYRVMNQLQGEGMLLENSKTTVETLMKDIESKNSSGLQSEQSSQEGIQDAMKGKEDQVRDALNYLMKNQETLDESQTKLIDTLK